MLVNPDVVGREFLAPEPFVVNADRVRLFSDALYRPECGQSHEHSVAATFPITASLQAMESLALDPEVGMDWSRVVHGDQTFEYFRPLAISMSLMVRTVVESVKSVGLNEYVGVRTFFNDGDDLVLTASATIVVRGVQ